MATSQNGWPAYNTTANFVRGNAAGFGFWCANDDVKVIFEDLVKRFDDGVEPLAGPILDDWSWANRNVRGSDTTVSNHASATALDLNALQHPRGVRNTFSEEKREKVRKLVARYSGAIRWGGTYQNIPDDMHFEINTSKATVKKVADGIRADQKRVEEAMANLTKQNLEDIADAILKHQTTLTEQDAKWMAVAGTKRKVGDKVSLQYIWKWGGGGIYRLYDKLNKIEAKLDALTKAISKSE